ncbi:uncharacterized protein GGS22DRAFT_192749 [Annulohypoxylon maeteangense]|uniref:uncharacterized protein n=1 Tax=Annulohypoxylon maeteangense TaxID=1927788 RepID=UPI002007627C|nr:uncharacterized protein GGS22DRAFT_192749 [Annulohypoxylon maeteangense]KAI0880912.1 hypothetical protein GGS22DRAFT_192749 [Annulohypoxylon maeteangense]
MRSRSKTCTYPRNQDGAVDATPLPPIRNELRREEVTAKSPNSATLSITDERGVGFGHDELSQRDLWQSSSLGSLALTVPPGSNIDSAEATSAPSSSLMREAQRTSHVNSDNTPMNSQPNISGLRTASNISPYMDTYPISGLIVKKRYVSPTHWLFCSTLSPHALDWLDQQVKSQGRIWQDIMTCKLLCRSIKAGRVIPWTQGQYGGSLPAKNVADKLLDAYLRTSESVYRIIHVPTSKRAYDALWENSGLASSAHVVQLQLCLAIGACFHDDVFSLRPQAQQWVREAEHWLIASGKLRATVFDVQTMCLLQLARQTSQHLPEHQVWASSGALIRAAMSVGLHRDPTKLLSMPIPEIEMRRRLWATIMELSLDSCIDAGGPPMLSSDDFDCILPSNLNDDELDLDSGEKIAPRDPTEYTDTSIQIALGRTQAIRLSIAKYINSVRVNHSPEETTRLTSELMSEYRSLARHLHSLNPPPTKFQQQYCEFVLTRYIFALHVSYMPRAMKDPAKFYRSRTLCMDTALRFASFFLPLTSSLQDPLIATMHEILPFEEHSSDFVRLLICGGGPFRSIPWKAFTIIAADLAAMLHQANDTSPWMTVVPFNQTQSGNRIRSIELITLLREAVKLTKKRIHAGHTNVKDIVWVNVNLAGIEAAMEGTSSEQAMDAKGKETLSEAIGLFQEMAGTGTVSWDDPPSSRDERLLAASEFWSMGFAGSIDWDTDVGC